MAAIKMSVVGLTVDPSSNSPIVVLRDEEGRFTLPIWIGILEASSIATQLEKIELSRPMTHDLFVSVLENAGMRLSRVLVNDLRENTYFARIFFQDDEGNEFDVDARPSDSIAMALRVEAEIFVEEGVLERAEALDKKALEHAEKSMDDKWKEILESLDPDDLGKYRM
ncbi:MAG: bifunctional nuclease family protein [Candidatus Lernaella stagnicola]|nr:bifunctional nuclease family protein [Candidatus Lernaella stagnicola]